MPIISFMHTLHTYVALSQFQFKKKRERQRPISRLPANEREESLKFKHQTCDRTHIQKVAKGARIVTIKIA